MHAVNFDSSKTKITLLARDFVALAGALRKKPVSESGKALLQSLRLAEAVAATEAEDTIVTVHLYWDEAASLLGLAMLDDNQVSEQILGQIIGNRVSIHVADVFDDLLEDDDTGVESES